MTDINILCLHGCNQTMDVFKSILKEFERLCAQNKIGLTYTEAKYDHPLGGKTWYKQPLVVADIGKIEYSEDLVSDVMNDVNKLITDNKINVLLGFSQGGNVVDTYLGYHPDDRIKCALILSSYSLVDPNRKVSDVPIMNIISKSDAVVPYELAPTSYSHIDIVEHDKGHKMPTSKPVLRDIIKYIESKCKS